MADARVLEVDILSWWHAGTGRGGGQDADALVEVDGDRLPYLPGRHLRGLLRDASLRLEVWGGLAEGTTALLFGDNAAEREERGDRRIGRHDTWPGCLAVGNAVLPEPLRAWLRDPSHRRVRESEQARLRRGLSVFVTQTAIQEGTGVAKDDTLRRIEVTLPLRLQARVRWAPEARLMLDLEDERERIEAEAGQWPARLRSLLPLVRTVGAHRSRGYGRARLSLVGDGP